MRRNFSVLAAALAVSSIVAVSGRTVAADTAPLLSLDPGGHTDLIWRVAVSSDNRYAYTASYDKTVREWDMRTGTCSRVIRPPIGGGREGWVHGLAVSRDGKLLALAGHGTPKANAGRVLVIDLDSLETRHVFDGHTELVRALAFSPDGKQLASASEDFSVRVWDLSAGKQRHALKGHSQGVVGLAYSPDGKTLASVSFDATLRLWNPAAGKEVSVFRGHKDRVFGVAWSADGRQLATGGSDRSIFLRSADGKVKRKFENLASEVNAIAFLPGGKSLIYTLGGNRGADTTCHRLDLDSGRDTPIFTEHTNTVLDGAVTSDGALAVTTGGDALETYVWRPDTGAVVHRLGGRNRSTRAAAWSADGSSFAWGTRRMFGTPFFRHEVRRTFSPARLEFGPTHAPTPQQPLPDGFTSARIQQGDLQLSPGGSTTYNVLRRTANGIQPVQRLTTVGDDDEVYCCSFVGPNKAAVGSVRGLYLFDAATGKQLRAFRGHTSYVYAIAPSPDGRYFLTASQDQTLRVWRADRDEPLLTYFFAGDEWIAFSPQGYYACSPGGERLIGWHVNNGPDKLATFHPAERFHKQLYRPDVIRRVLELGDVGKALAAADRDLGRATAMLSVAQVLPPEVRVVEPAAAELTTDAAKLSLTARVRAVGGRVVTAVHLLIDGRPYPDAGASKTFEPPLLGEADVTLSAEVPPGRHTFAVQAESDVSQSSSRPLRVTRRGDDGESHGRLFVLAVGVSQYKTSDLNLEFAARDAGTVVDLLRDKSRPLPFRDVETKLLTNADATRERVMAELARLRERSTPGDCVLVYFASHGHRDKSGRVHLLPSDADPKDFLGTGIEGARLRNALAAVKGQILLVLDACHSGAAVIDGRDASAAVGDLARDLSREATGVMVMCACLGGQEAEESRKERHGVYTKAILEALGGKGGRAPDDGVVYQNHAHLFALDFVKKATKGGQVPTQAIPGDIPPMPLSRP